MLSTKFPRCKHCKAKLVPERPSQVVHRECVEAWAEAQAAKRKRAEEKQRKAALKVEKAQRKADLVRLSDLEEQCRKIVQKIARLRDRNDGCISCHVGPEYGGIWHGSHYRPAGNNAAVQFHLWNIHKACEQCNFFKGGNIGAYRPRLLEKIGADRVAWLDSQTQVTKYTREYLYRFKAVMGKRLRRMEKWA
jgi:hypothetical protein